jgi:phosphoesterase RecJ-like protein
MIYNDIGKLIKQYDNFAICSHTSPDGDSIGSMLALYNMLKDTGKKAEMFSDDVPPDRYSFLPGFSEIKVINEISGRFDYIFILDCGDLERIGRCVNLISSSTVLINIDHHISNKIYGKYNIVDSNASSVGEMMYCLFKINGYNITKDIAECLYTSIVTDTGGFKYSNTTSITLSTAGDLINTGIDFSGLNDRVFNMKTLPQVKLMSKVTSTIDVLSGESTAVLTMTQEMLKECNATEEDAGDFVNIARDIKDVEVGVFIKEVEGGKARVSLRSKTKVDVRKIAETFGGGGHIRASGCTVDGTVNEVKAKIINEIKKYL